MFNRFLRILSIVFFFVVYRGAFSQEDFLLVNGNTNQIVMRLGCYVEERVSPCSTFKIALSLMGYDAGILIDERLPVWNFQEGYDDWLALWKDPQTPTSWMRSSCVWYSKVVSLQLGKETLQRYLRLMGYGNQDLSSGLEHPFWINASLRISPKEQVDFLRSMILGKLPVSSKAAEMTKALLFREKLSNGWTLFGKTGWSGSSLGQEELGWFVGWIEKERDFFPFAYLLRQHHIPLDQRVSRVKELIKDVLL